MTEATFDELLVIMQPHMTDTQSNILEMEYNTPPEGLVCCGHHFLSIAVSLVSELF